MIKYISPVNILFVSNTSSRRLQRNNFLSSKTFSRRLARCLQDVFKTYLQDDFKTSWKTKKCYAEDVLKTSSRHVLKTSRRRLEDQQMFAGLLYIFKSYKSIFQKNLKVLSRYYVLFLILRPISRLVELSISRTFFSVPSNFKCQLYVPISKSNFI